ncbi:thiamine diphosphokinase [Egicoccus sp. AB-alg2]|uniref:thiamine diphosphokinase n=1 Tax=Egicoccus sp. AB-alg2 TaxID=3242693 RepID=UPI00359EAC24
MLPGPSVPFPDAATPDIAPEIVVLVGGDPVLHDRVPQLPQRAFVIAADSGLHLAHEFGLPVHLVVGDLDSVRPERLAAARAAGVPVHQHPVDKDETDLAIALDAATRFAPARVTLLGGHGGRLDHLLGNALVLAAEAYRELTLTALVASATITVVRGERELRGQPGDYVSLLPAHGPARGITTSGLRFPLSDEDLPAGSTRGISNQFLSDRATVRLTDGVLLAVQPGERGPDHA